MIQEARLETKTYPFGDGVIGHISLHAFYQDPVHSSAADISEAIADIKRNSKLKGLVLDLRNNAGGFLPQAVAVTGLFITKGIVVSIKDNTGQIEHLRNIDDQMAYDGPMIVLTSKASASAAEIVAQTLQDYGRALVVGDEHTYGKGSFQTFSYDPNRSEGVNPKGEFKVTRGCYYTVSGKSPQLVGVKADVVVPSTIASLDIGESLAKYPLLNDSIEPNFDDKLLDIPFKQREQISWLYRLNLQTKIDTYTKHLDTIRKNSASRIEKDAIYQQLMAEMKKEDENIEPKFVEVVAKVDPQLQESIRVLQDLIVLNLK